MAITIGKVKVNKRGANIVNVRCDRGTALGNPFPMRHESQRNEVCDKYELWFKDAVKTMPVRKELAHIYKLH